MNSTSIRHLTIAGPDMNVREARDRYLSENSFTMAGYTEERSTFDFFGLSVVIKNSVGRIRGLPLHDLHHVALGFGTDLVGECEVSAWELRNGVPGYGLLVQLLVLQGFLLGLVLAPRRTIASFRAAGGRASLFSTPLPLADLLAMKVGELRAHLGVPPQGMASHEPRRHRANTVLPAT